MVLQWQQVSAVAGDDEVDPAGAGGGQHMIVVWVGHYDPGNRQWCHHGANAPQLMNEALRRQTRLSKPRRELAAAQHIQQFAQQ
ncbi:hypothetical protein MW290_29300 [Aquincola tertiaricarbonis]|uniref:Chromo domain-containing protein n=1 Tax=Aquincola tertiaricarbonis TaxID=391953 RepID=A0ABY4SEC1_AQUTE|nr:hypothetical protein [Aquincola tertiaricarbonis]URI09650.1 hypothetical protein MW290_29300 [Aquincola tertiaricarbonis]